MKTTESSFSLLSSHHISVYRMLWEQPGELFLFSQLCAEEREGKEADSCQTKDKRYAASWESSNDRQTKAKQHATCRDLVSSWQAQFSTKSKAQSEAG